MKYYDNNNPTDNDSVDEEILESLAVIEAGVDEKEAEYENNFLAPRNYSELDNLLYGEDTDEGEIETDESDDDDESTIDESIDENVDEAIEEEVVEVKDDVEAKVWEIFHEVQHRLLAHSSAMVTHSEKYISGNHLLVDGMREFTKAHSSRVTKSLTNSVVEPQLVGEQVERYEDISYSSLLGASKDYFDVSMRLMKIAKEDYFYANRLVMDGIAFLNNRYSERARLGQVKLAPSRYEN